MRTPTPAIASTSRTGPPALSADLHLGLLSPLEVVERADGPGEGRRIFRQELVWRDFYAHVLFHEPAVRHRAFRPAFDAIAWSADRGAPRGLALGPDRLSRSSMRRCASSPPTGWMPNRARMLVASFLVKDLLIDWRAGEAHFLRSLVDGDVASNNGGWQWAASTGHRSPTLFPRLQPGHPGPAPRPGRDYVRRWVPELAAVPSARIHAPWEMTDGRAVRRGVPDRDRLSGADRRPRRGPGPRAGCLRRGAPDLVAAGLGGADLVGRLVVDGRAASQRPVAQPVAGAVPWALEATVGDRALRQAVRRHGRTRHAARGPVAEADDDEVVDARPHLRRRRLRHRGQIA